MHFSFLKGAMIFNFMDFSFLNVSHLKNSVIFLPFIHWTFLFSLFCTQLHRFHQVDSESLTVAVNFWWRSEIMSGMSEHMDSYYLRRILKRYSRFFYSVSSCIRTQIDKLIIIMHPCFMSINIGHLQDLPTKKWYALLIYYVICYNCILWMMINSLFLNFLILLYFFILFFIF